MTTTDTADSSESKISSSYSSSKPFSLSFGSSKTKSSKPLPISSPRPGGATRKRPHSSLHDSEDEDDDHATRPQLISGFDHKAGGAISLTNSTHRQKSQLVIKAQKNRDFRDESRRKRGKKNLLPAEVQAMRNGNGGVDTTDVINSTTPAYGLSFVKREVEPLVSAESSTQINGTAHNEGPDERSEDQVAMQALMGDSGSGRKSNLVLPAVEEAQQGQDASDDDADGYYNEDEQFRKDVASRPDAASLADYAAVPVEEFGAALLRGMGWKEGEAIGRRKDAIIKPRLLERRPAHLGLGAKVDEYGMIGKAAKDIQREKESRLRKTGDYRRSSERDRHAHRDSFREHRERRDRHREEGSRSRR